MGSVTPRTTTKSSSRPHITLMPWDPESPEHVQRMIDQRIACGWNSQAVEGWRGLQRDGKVAMQWIALSNSDPEKNSRITSHIKAYPKETAPITDTASSLQAQTRIPTAQSFHPIGHISLDSWDPDASLANSTLGIYRIAAFYVSRVLQSSGVGVAAMDEIERMAVSPPLNARQLTIMTVANESPDEEEKHAAIGREKAKFSLQDWYARRGYVAYMMQEEAWFNEDSTGKKWPSTAVYMRKDIK